MAEWQPIETAPKDKSILLFWPTYEGQPFPRISIGHWKENPRLSPFYPDGKTPRPNADAIRAELAQRQMEAAYFSDSGELDDYEMAEHRNAPTHWMPLPEPPK